VEARKQGELNKGGNACYKGRVGNDTLIGGPGAEVLDGRDGNDSLIGDEGNSFTRTTPISCC